jgi:hypothetical protein
MFFEWLFGKNVFYRSNDEFVGAYDHIFVSQKRLCDCGIACCAMLLNFNGENSSQIYDELGKAHDCPNWTIDLFHYLYNRGINVTMYTNSFGINQNHRNISGDFYASLSDSEINRNHYLFQQAKKNSWPVENEELSIEYLGSVLNDAEYDAVLMLLVDANYLLAYAPASTCYSGHYIVVVAFNPDTKSFSYLDPAGNSNLKEIKKEKLDLARRQPGTDFDIIICRRSKNQDKTNTD